MADNTDLPKPKGNATCTPQNTNAHKLLKMGKKPDFGGKSGPKTPA